MTLDELNKLDFKTVADWPLSAKLGLLVIGFVGIVGASWWFFWKPALQELETGQRKEQELRASFTTKKGQAVNL